MQKLLHTRRIWVKLTGFRSNLNAVTGVIKQPDIGALQLRAKGPHRPVNAALVEIELGAAADKAEADRPQCVCHQPGVVLGIVQRRDVLIGRIADDQRDAFVGKRRR